MGGRAHPLGIEARVVATAEGLLTVRADFRRDDEKLMPKPPHSSLLQQLGPGHGRGARAIYLCLYAKAATLI